MKESSTKIIFGILFIIFLFLIFFISYIIFNNYVYLALSFLSLIFGAGIILLYDKSKKNKITKERTLDVINEILSKYFLNISYKQRCNNKNLELKYIVDSKDYSKISNYILCNYNKYNMNIFDEIIKQSDYSATLDASNLIKVFDGTWFIINTEKEYDDLKLYTKNILVEKIFKSDLLHKEWFSNQQVDYVLTIDDEYFNNNFNCYTKIKESKIELDKKLLENIKQLHKIVNNKGIIFSLQKNKIYIGLDLGKSLFELDDELINEIVLIIIKIINDFVI